MPLFKQEGNTPLHYLAGFTSSPATIIKFLDMNVVYDALNNVGATVQPHCLLGGLLGL